MTEEQSNITRIELDGKEYILIGTAHVSKSSAEEVKAVIETELPDSVCIELDKQRYENIMDENKWKDTDIFKVIKEKKTTLLLINLAISSFQKRIAKQFGIEAGREMIQGRKSAEEHGATLVLADRNIQITFSRIWGNIDAKGKVMLLSSILTGIFSNESITEEELEELKSRNSIDAILSEFTDEFPLLKKPLVDERDQYLAEKIRRAPGKKVVAVLGAAHIPGVQEEIQVYALHQEQQQHIPGVQEEIHKKHDLKKLLTVPEKSKWPKRIGWLIPILVVTTILATFFINPDAGWQQTQSWLIWNAALSAVGAMVGFAHPLAVIAAFVVAPITSLNPLIASGFVAGMVQAYIKKPQVSDFEQLNEDVHSVKGFWRNKATRVLLVVLFANLGSAIGTFIAGTDIIRLFLENLF